MFAACAGLMVHGGTDHLHFGRFDEGWRRWSTQSWREGFLLAMEGGLRSRRLEACYIALQNLFELPESIGEADPRGSGSRATSAELREMASRRPWVTTASLKAAKSRRANLFASLRAPAPRLAILSPSSPFYSNTNPSAPLHASSSSLSSALSAFSLLSSSSVPKGSSSTSQMVWDSEGGEEVRR